MKFVDTMHGKVTAKDGLLWCNGEIVPLPLADRIAEEHGHTCAERLVKALEAPDEPASR